MKCKFNVFDYYIHHNKLMTNFYPGLMPECRHKDNYYGECNDKQNCKLREDFKNDKQ